MINSGEFVVEIDGVKKEHILKKGDSFGELALIYNSPRSAGLFAIKSSYVWGISRPTFKKVLKDMNKVEYNENIEIVKNIKFLEGLTSEQQNSLATNLVSLTFKANENIVNKGDSADSYYLIKSGVVGCYDEEKLIRYLGEGDSFGE